MVLSRKDVKSMTPEQLIELYDSGEFELSADYVYKGPANIYEAIYNLIKEARIIMTYEGEELTKENFIERLWSHHDTEHTLCEITRAIDEA